MFVNIYIVYFIQIILWIIFFILPIIIVKKGENSFTKKYFKSIVAGIIIFTIILFIKGEYIDYVVDICYNDNDISNYKGVPPISCNDFYNHYKQLLGVGWPVTLIFMSIFYLIYNIFIFLILKIKK